MARRAKPGDIVYNARRRYARQAERYAKKAQQASGMEAARYTNLARTSLESAIATYADPMKARGSSLIRKLSSQLSPRKPVRKLSDSQRRNLIDRSLKATETARDSDDDRRDAEAREILSSEAGSRIYAATVGIWKGAGDTDQAIMDYFGVDSMMDVIEMIEDAGIDIYGDPESQVKYDEAVAAIQNAYL